MSEERVTDILYSEKGRIVAYVFSVVFALMLVITVIKIVGGFFSSSPSSTITVSAAPIQLPNQNLVAQLPDAHLFGSFQSLNKNLPDTTLSLQLQGLMTASDSKSSTALIALPGQAAKVYKVGQTVPGGATIFQILQNAVVLRDRGKLEKLPLNRGKLLFAIANQKRLF